MVNLAATNSKMSKPIIHEKFFFLYEISLPKVRGVYYLRMCVIRDKQR